MPKFEVGWTYTVWVRVEADNEQDAFDRALEVPYHFVDVAKTGATMELNEYEDPITNELLENDNA